MSGCVHQVITISLTAANKDADISGLLPQDVAPSDVLELVVNNLDTGACVRVCVFWGDVSCFGVTTSNAKHKYAQHLT